MKIISFFLFVLSFAASNSFAQHASWQSIGPIGKISGIVVDSKTAQPISFANLALIRTKNDSLMSGVMSDINGNFIFDKVYQGRYVVKITYIGYKNFLSDTFLISPQSTEKDFGTIQMESGATDLTGGTVTADAGLFQNQIDKKVYSVDKNLMNAGGTAADVLSNIPSIQTDVDGNIGMHGDNNVTILIDGKPNVYSGSDMMQAMSKIPASMIDRVEVISNPSAKYDAGGTGGIINIVLKKNKMQGLNGNITLGTGTNRKYNISGLLNYRTKKYNFFVNDAIRFDNKWSKSTQLRQFFTDDTTYYLNQYGMQLNNSQNNSLRVGLDLFLNPKNTLSINGTVNNSIQFENNFIEYKNLNSSNVLQQYYSRNAFNTEKTNTESLNLNYKKLFKKKEEELSFDGTWQKNIRNATNNFYNQSCFLNGAPDGSDSILQNNFLNTSLNNFTAQVDFSYPINDNSKLEAGAKTNLRFANSGFTSISRDTLINEWNGDYALDDSVNYADKVFAAYTTYSNKLKKNLSFLLGLRAEETMMNFKTSNPVTDFSNQYLNFFPSVFFKQEIKKTTELTLNYSRRINRPGKEQLNPFVDYTDPLNLKVGNLNLMPEFINAFEFGYTKFLKKQYITATMFYRVTQNSISRVRTVDASGVATTSFINANSLSSLGVELIGKLQLTKWWDFTPSFNFNQTTINANDFQSGLSNTKFTYSARFSSNMKIKKTLNLQLNGNYNAPTPLPQGLMNAMYSMDIAAKKDIFKSRAAVSVSLSDIFNTRQWGFETGSYNFTQSFVKKKESRVATITFTWRFGNGGDNQQKKNQKTDLNSGGDDY